MTKNLTGLIAGGGGEGVVSGHQQRSEVLGESEG